MRYLIILSMLMSPFCISAQRYITIEECYEMSRLNYPEIERYSLIDKSKDYSISNVQKSWLPQLSVNAKASYQSDVTTIPLNVLSEVIPIIDFPAISKDQYMVQAEVTQTIWDGGAAKSQRRVIASESEIERTSVDVKLYALKSRVNALYFAILLQKEVLKQNDILNSELLSNIDRVNALIDNGIANLYDKRVLEVEVLQLKQRSIAIEASLTSYINMLSYLIGVDLPQDIEFIVPQTAEVISDNINRPELQLYEMQNKLLTAKEGSLKSTLMPNFGLFVNGGYGRPALDMLSDDFSPFYVAGVRLSWNIGTIYRHKNSMQSIDIMRKGVDIDRDKFIFNSKLDMINERADIKRVREQMTSDSEIVELRRSIKEASQVKFDNGTLSMTDLVSDINSLNEAEQRLSTRKIELLSLIYNYLYITNN